MVCNVLEDASEDSDGPIALIRQDITEKKKLLGMEGRSIRAAINSVTASMLQDHETEVPYDTVLDTVFQMDDVATKRDVVIVQGHLFKEMTSFHNEIKGEIAELSSIVDTLLSRGTITWN